MFSPLSENYSLLTKITSLTLQFFFAPLNPPFDLSFSDTKNLKTKNWKFYSLSHPSLSTPSTLTPLSLARTLNTLALTSLSRSTLVSISLRAQLRCLYLSQSSIVVSLSQTSTAVFISLSPSSTPVYLSLKAHPRFGTLSTQLFTVSLCSMFFNLKP